MGGPEGHPALLLLLLVVVVGTPQRSSSPPRPPAPATQSRCAPQPLPLRPLHLSSSAPPPLFSSLSSCRHRRLRAGWHLQQAAAEGGGRPGVCRRGALAGAWVVGGGAAGRARYLVPRALALGLWAARCRGACMVLVPGVSLAAGWARQGQPGGGGGGGHVLCFVFLSGPPPFLPSPCLLVPCSPEFSHQPCRRPMATLPQ